MKDWNDPEEVEKLAAKMNYKLVSNNGIIFTIWRDGIAEHSEGVALLPNSQGMFSLADVRAFLATKLRERAGRIVDNRDAFIHELKMGYRVLGRRWEEMSGATREADALNKLAEELESTNLQGMYRITYDRAVQVIDFIHDRLVHQHGENQSVDYMWGLRSVKGLLNEMKDELKHAGAK